MRDETAHRRAVQIGTARKRYVHADVQEVVRLVNEEGLSIKKATARVNDLVRRHVPTRTVYRFLQDPDRSSRPGPPPVLTREEEDRLVSYFFKMADLGVGLTTEEAGKRVVQMVSDGSGRRNPWADGRLPGRDFWEGFMRRHPEVSKRTPEALKKARAQQDNVYVYSHFFDLLEDLVNRKQYLPRNIYNDDETMAKLKQGWVLARRGEKTVYVLEDAEWPHITVLSCINAAGEFLEPLVIMSAKSIMEKWCLNESIPGTRYAANSGTYPVDRNKVLPKLMSNAPDATRLTPGVAIDSRPNPIFTAPTPVAPVPFTPTPTKALNRLSKTSLRSMIENLEQENHRLKNEVAREKSARLDTVLRLPLHSTANTTNTASAPAGKKRSIGALRSVDGKARVVTRAQLQAAIDEEVRAKEAAKATKRPASASSNTGRSGKRAKIMVQQDQSDDEDDVLNLDSDE
jgi:hypothetical protein